ncbi:unnamed protein product [Mytilus edulis]|uniref:Reverse transcriptase domain-containing protein n=1 Tax=Mytilus edulis TaxID=6550 RepID=A0A8S3UW50_MYTED|nr:unnamed protein product [Mytilus edulis]
MPPKRGKSRQSDQPTHKKQKTNIDYTKLAAEILRLQSDKTNASNQPTTSSGVNIEADIHVDTDVSQNQLHGTIQIPTSTQNVNIDPVSCTVSAPNPTSAASEESTTQIHVNPTCTVAPDDTTTSVLNPTCSTSKEFDIQTVVETLFSEDKLATNLAHTSMSATSVKAHTQDFNALNINPSKMHNRTNRCQIRNKIPTPVNAELLGQELQGYDMDLRNMLIHGFTFGFSLNFKGTPSNKTCKNHKSATENPDAVYLKLAKESLSGRIAGPFKEPPFSLFVCSPLGLVPKSDGKFRLIHDLSFPKDDSINLGIPMEYSAVSYDSIDNVVQLVKSYGQSCQMAKTDVENAFRIIPIQKSDYNLLGFNWNGFFYYDKCLPMGASSAPKTFETLSVALQWIMQSKYRSGGMSHILDDFLFVGPPQSQKCNQDLQTFIQLCNRLGIPIKKEKTVLPTTVITIYGIEVDSNIMECRLPQEKIEKIQAKLHEFSRRKKVTLRQLQSLIGLLNFACTVVCPGRAFLRRLIDLTIGVSHPCHYIRLTRESKADIESTEGSTMVGTKSNTCSPTFVGDLTDEAKHLINSALTPSTKASYQKTWQKLIEFLGHQQISLPLQLAQVANFIGNLFTKGLKPATIASHISALSYVHKMLNIQDPTALFIIRKALKGCENLTPSADARLPITKAILDKMIINLPSVVRLHVHQLLLKTIFLVAFNGFFRLGELVVRSKQSIGRVLQRQDILFTWEKGILKGVELTLRFLKITKLTNQ